MMTRVLAGSAEAGHPPEIADVAIAGAGPAGAWAAYLLARQGARVVVFDRSHPREKPCGGGITARALAIVRDAIPPASLPATRVRTARFVDAGNGRSVSVRLQGDGADSTLVVASRRSFDGMLLDAARRAGACLVADRVSHIERSGRRRTIHTAEGARCAADVIVGADGANSLVRRQLFRPFSRDRLSIATGYFAHGITSDEVVIEFVADPPGYIWSFPRPDHLAIGVCAQANAGVGAARLRERARQWMMAARLADDAPLTPYSWPIPSLPADDFQRLEVSGEGWLLAGDAAGLVDPITREGIFYALESARFAAEAIAGGRRVPEQYAERVRSELASELARAARFKAGFFRPRFTRLVLEALAESEPIRGVMADLIAGIQPYRGLRWRLLRTFEPRLAFGLFVR
jgi:geranylgeranyl reductase family protein